MLRRAIAETRLSRIILQIIGIIFDISLRPIFRLTLQAEERRGDCLRRRRSIAVASFLLRDRELA